MRTRRYAESTIKQHMQNILLFPDWLKKYNKSVKECGYIDMIRFVDSVFIIKPNHHFGKININRILSSVTYYYDSIAEKYPSIRNPAKNIRVKNTNKRLVHDLLNYEELLNLNRVFESKSPRHIRNQVITGLLIFQGLTTRELQNLRVDDLMLSEGKIFIRESSFNTLKRGTDSRYLQLDAVQVVDIVEYLNNIRPKILSGKYLSGSGRKPGRGKRVRKSDQFIISLKGSPNIKNTLHHLFIDLHNLNPKVKNARQLRQSLIAHWLTEYNLRHVQYMAGYRYVGSTEWYKGTNLEELKREIDAFHPLRMKFENAEY